MGAVGDIVALPTTVLDVHPVPVETKKFPDAPGEDKPVPPLAAPKMPPSIMPPTVGVLGVNPVVPPLKEDTDPGTPTGNQAGTPLESPKKYPFVPAGSFARVFVADA